MNLFIYLFIYLFYFIYFFVYLYPVNIHLYPNKNSNQAQRKLGALWAAPLRPPLPHSERRLCGAGACHGRGTAPRPRFGGFWGLWSPELGQKESPGGGKDFFFLILAFLFLLFFPEPSCCFERCFGALDFGAVVIFFLVWKCIFWRREPQDDT